MTPFWWRSNI